MSRISSLKVHTRTPFTRPTIPALLTYQKIHVHRRKDRLFAYPHFSACDETGVNCPRKIQRPQKSCAVNWVNKTNRKKANYQLCFRCFIETQNQEHSLLGETKQRLPISDCNRVHGPKKQPSTVLSLPASSSLVFGIASFRSLFNVCLPKKEAWIDVHTSSARCHIISSAQIVPALPFRSHHKYSKPNRTLHISNILSGHHDERNFSIYPQWKNIVLSSIDSEYYWIQGLEGESTTYV